MRVVDVIRSARKHYVPDFMPVDGFEGVMCHRLVAAQPVHGFREYLVLRDEGRGAVWFCVKEPSFDPEAVSTFLEFIAANRDLPFDGETHHKVVLPHPVGRFSHALVCHPGLDSHGATYPALKGRVGKAFPIFKCEIGDDDTEVLVDARIHGRDSIASADWARGPHPVIDLRFEIVRATPSNSRWPNGRQSGRRSRTFKVWPHPELARLLECLADATPESVLEVRSFRGDIRRLTPADLTPSTAADLDAFLRGEPPV